eukprot:COSAG06_NODE_53288_length_301_cov_0.509901_1_plen_44_part_10
MHCRLADKLKNQLLHVHRVLEDTFPSMSSGAEEPPQSMPRWLER